MRPLGKIIDMVRLVGMKLHHRLKSTMIYVTHDQVEAMTLGDRICIMEDGYIRQVGSPGEVFDNPANLFVAISSARRR